MKSIGDLRLTRILGILSAVQSGVADDADGLAERFGVTRRTIFRDLSILSEAGASCVFEKEKNRYILPESTLRSIERLSHAETVNLLLMFRIARYHPAVRDSAAADTAINKIRQVIPADLANDIDELLHCVSVRHPNEQAPNQELFERIFFATSHRHQIQVWISGAVQTVLRLHPYHLLYHEDRWVLVALSRTTEQLETFPLATIDQVDVLELKYEAAEKPPVEELERHAMAAQFDAVGPVDV